MGTSRSTAQFVKKIHQVGEATDRNRKKAVTDGAAEAKKVMLAAASAKGVQPGGLIAKRKWGVRFDVRGGELPTALVRFTGPFHLVNNPTDPHYIAAKGLGGTRDSRQNRAFQASAAGFLGESTRGAFSGQGHSWKRRSKNLKGRRALKVNGEFRAYMFHPGTKGKGIFQASRTVAERTVPPAMADSMKGAWHRVLA